MSGGKGLWIDPDGKVIDVITHIGYIYSHLEEFGLTPEKRDEILKKWGENRKQEGNGRTEIISKAYDMDWIRIRDYKSHWTIQSKVFTPKTKRNLVNWAKQEGDSLDSPVDITEFNVLKDFLVTARGRWDGEKFPEIKVEAEWWVDHGKAVHAVHKIAMKDLVRGAQFLTGESDVGPISGDMTYSQLHRWKMKNPSQKLHNNLTKKDIIEHSTMKEFLSLLEIFSRK